jgi:hypothetical protein
LGSLLKNNEEKLLNDAMYHIMLEKYVKASFMKKKKKNKKARNE